jgi:hypothetical protein
MNTVEVDDHERLARVTEFGIPRTADFPPTTEGGQLFADIAVVVEEVDTFAAAQSASLSAGRESTASKTAANKTLRAKLKMISVTADSMAVDEPAVKSMFLMPSGKGDQVMLNAARGYLANATPRKTEFIKKEMPTDFLTALEAAITQLQEDMSAKRRDTEARVTARAGLKTTLKRGLKDLRKLDPIVRNKYHDDPVTLAAWDSASRPARHARKPKSAPPPAPPKSDTSA